MIDSAVARAQAQVDRTVDPKRDRRRKRAQHTRVLAAHHDSLLERSVKSVEIDEQIRL
jgi:hypothetical protein